MTTIFAVDYYDDDERRWSDQYFTDQMFVTQEAAERSIVDGAYQTVIRRENKNRQKLARLNKRREIEQTLIDAGMSPPFGLNFEYKNVDYDRVDENNFPYDDPQASTFTDEELGARVVAIEIKD